MASMVQAFREQKPTSHVAKCSRKQEGVITAAQARMAGLTQRQVDLMVERGVPITPLQAVVAASFATGGLASHRLCLWLWSLRPQAEPEAEAEAEEFSVPYGSSVRVPGVKIYRVKKMPRAFRRGIVPV